MDSAGGVTEFVLDDGNNATHKLTFPPGAVPDGTVISLKVIKGDGLSFPHLLIDWYLYDIHYFEFSHSVESWKY